jgi:hypothetical protein
MMNLERLASRGLRAYEIGRARMAARVAPVLLPAAAICVLEQRGRPTCACLAISLIALSVWLRWRDRRGVQVARTGLLAGSIPLVVGLALGRLGVRCDDAPTASLCTCVSALAGVGAGVLVAVRETREGAGLGSWLTAIVVAALAAGLGCVRLGVAGLAGAAGGMAAGAIAAARFLPGGGRGSRPGGGRSPGETIGPI